MEGINNLLIRMVDFKVDIEDIVRKVAAATDKLLKNGIENFPQIEKLVLSIIERTFGPQVIMQNIAMIAVLQITLLSYSSLSSVWSSIVLNITEQGRREKKLLEKAKVAKSFEEWQTIAEELDEIRGYDLWRHQNRSLLYDHKMLEKRIRFTREMMQRGDVFDLMFRMRSGLARDQFGMQHEGLFSRALVGTKVIVEQYLETVADGLNYICDAPIGDEEVTKYILFSALHFIL
jgi:TAG lipase / steryl ester hydrolase / phospholipase A2 / LPA acyltransferase